MAKDRVDEQVRKILRDLKQYGGLTPLAEVLAPETSKRTIYRHAGSKPQNLDPATRGALLQIFAELKLLDDYELSDILEAVRELKRRATSNAADGPPIVRRPDDPGPRVNGEGEGRSGGSP